MSWSCAIIGSPPSVNHLYLPAWKYDKRGHRYKGRRKNPVAKKYQDDAVLVLRSAKPSRWAPTGWVRVYIKPYLHDHADLDNLAKILLDSIEIATGVNDKWMVPCWGVPELGVAEKDERLLVTIEELS